MAHIHTSQSDEVENKLNILKMIPSNVDLFDDLSSLSVQESEQSGPFTSLERSEAFLENRKSRDLINIDFYAYFSFSQELIAAMQSVKNESKETLVEDGEHFPDPEGSTQSSHDINDLEEKVKHLLESYTFSVDDEKNILLDCESAKTKSDLDLQAVPAKNKLNNEKNKVVEDEEIYYDTMSGYWRMLAAYDEFHISPPYYNAYSNEKPHWLETKPIPFEITENARKKCLQWLSDNFKD